MKPLFADAVYFLALLNPADQYHAKAMEFHRSGNEPLLTTEYVLLEVGDALSRSQLRRGFERFLAVLESGLDVEIMSSGAELFRKGCTLYASRPDKEWSLTDCTSFVVMKENDLTEALTADHHFEQAGFTALMNA